MQPHICTTAARGQGDVSEWAGNPLLGTAAESHIIGQGTCKDVGRVKKGDVLTAEVIYELAKHAPVKHDGNPDWIMGTDGVYVGIE